MDAISKPDHGEPRDTSPRTMADEHPTASCPPPPASVANCLTDDERAALVRLEERIDRGLATSLEVGDALLAIREGRLYREQHATFDAYCRERWRISRFYAYRLAEAAATVAMLPIGNRPANEAQVRPLTLLPPAERAPAWQEAVTTAPGGQVTAAHVQTVVARRRHEVHYASESGEWYTPPHIVRRAVQVLGAIDLDPCAEPARAIPAARHYAIEEDGLSRPWTAPRVYLNPPYGREIGRWIEKLLHHHRAGEVTEAIALVPARVDTEWFSLLRDSAICFVGGRLRFSGAASSAPFPSAVVYLGPHWSRFLAAFRDIGDVWMRVDHEHRPPPAAATLPPAVNQRPVIQGQRSAM